MLHTNTVLPIPLYFLLLLIHEGVGARRQSFRIFLFLVLEFRIRPVLLAQVCSPLIMLEKLCCCGIWLSELRRRRM